MSDQVTIPNLNQQQADAILAEALSRRMYEGVDGALPEDPKVRMTDAENLTAQAVRASANGNGSDNVSQILFLAQVDLKPPAPGTAAPAPAATATPEAAGFDMSTLSDAIIDSMLTQLDTHLDSPTVQNERQQLLAEKAKRQGVPDGQAPPAAPQAPPPPPVAADPVPADQGADESQAAPAAAADAGADAGAGGSPAPAASPVGGEAPAAPAATDGDRAALMAQVTLPMVKAHGIPLDEVDDLTVADLNFILSHPQGSAPAPVPDAPGPPPDAVITAPEQAMQLPPRIAEIQQDVPVEEPARAVPARFASDDGVSDGITPEREALEAQVTGPILKAYGQGRKKLPNIGDNELRLMIAHPDGQISQDTLLAARAADGGSPAAEAAPPVPPTTPEPAPAPLPPEPAGVAGDEPPPPAPAPAPAVEPEAPAAAPEPAPATEGEAALQEAIAERAQRQEPTDGQDGVARAHAIIKNERLPIPPDFDGEPKELPSRVGSMGQDQLYELHGERHALEARVAWLVSEAEDELSDLISLRKSAEFDAEENLPVTQAGKKLTEAQRAMKIANDAEVKKHSEAERQQLKVVGKLKLLRDLYHRDCQRLSRQMTRFTDEREDMP